MPPEENIEKRLQNLGQVIGRDDFVRQAVMARIRTQPASSSQKDRKPGIQLVVRRLIMNRFVRLGAAAVLILAVVGGVRTIGQLAPKPYTIDQTIEAMHSAHFLHIVKQDKAGNLEDERWEEIDSAGLQGRYRQNTPSRSFYVVDDLKTCMVYHAGEDKNTVVLYDHKDQSYTWHYAPGRIFDPTDGKPTYAVVAENVEYKGQTAHKLRELGNGTEVYIDAETKLPLALGEYECSFEEPPEGTFDIVPPKGAIVVDLRPGAPPAVKPQWMLDEEKREQEGKMAQAYFEEGRRALAAKDYTKAVDLLTKSLDISPKRNWASFWLGKALYGAKDYDQAIFRLTAVIDQVAEVGWTIPPYNLARGMAYQAKGMPDMARVDMQKVLPKMIEGLRSAKAASLFDLADDPLIIADGMREGCHPRPSQEQSVVLMINRLRVITGQNFGYDPNGTAEDKEQAIAAWEEWFKNGGQVQFTPDAKLIPVPGQAAAPTK
jgi:tetratricopeptide (TPR) repeat protein